MQNKIILPDLLKKRMFEHALSNPEIEICGLIGAHNKQATTIYPVSNIADDLTHNFLMEPEQQIDAMRKMRENKETLWGIYHSHPDTPPEPSQIDKEMAAYPDVYYFIISLVHKKPELNVFNFNGDNFEKKIIKFI